MQRRTVLVVDDSKFLRRANELAISHAGYSVLTASDGDQGLQIARDKHPDVIVLDMMLPKLSGPELLRTVTRTVVENQLGPQSDVHIVNRLDGGNELLAG
jgi:DNA-binding response OmpR family regulator